MLSNSFEQTIDQYASCLRLDSVLSFGSQFTTKQDGIRKDSNRWCTVYYRTTFVRISRNLRICSYRWGFVQMGFLAKEITLLTACKNLQNIRYVGVFVQVVFDCTIYCRWTRDEDIARNLWMTKTWILVPVISSRFLLLFSMYKTSCFPIYQKCGTHWCPEPGGECNTGSGHFWLLHLDSWWNFDHFFNLIWP